VIESIVEQLELLPGRLLDHLQITMLPLCLGVAISLPLGVLAVRNKRLRYPVLTVVSIVQTIPSLALLALMVPVFVGISGLTAKLAGFEVPALGFYPTVVALTLYSMLPILRNTVTGILDVDPAMTEAARGVGMTPLQALWRVELPLALPVIIAGIRTATVWTVGIATLATPVGQPCLGNYIFSGLQTRNWTAVLVGCFAAIGLAVLLDLLIGGLQKAAADRRKPLAVCCGSLFVGVFLVGLAGPSVAAWMQQTRTVRARENVSPGQSEASPIGTVVVGSKTFTEQYILAELISDRLQTAGFDTKQLESLGSNIVFKGLQTGEVDVYVDYTGTIWVNYMKQERSAPAWLVLQRVEGWLARVHQIRSVGPLGFENAYALAMQREQAEELNIRTIDDLAEHAPGMKIGADYEFFDRPEWKSLRASYELGFSDRVSYDSTFMYDALVNDEVDVISAFSSDGRIAQFDLLVLEDPRNVLPPYDALILLSPRIANRGEVVDTLAPLVGTIDVDRMRRANYMVDRDEDKRTIRQAADWLRSTAQ